MELVRLMVEASQKAPTIVPAPDPVIVKSGGCFAFGTIFMVQNSEGEVIEKKLEDIKYGDKVLVHNLSLKLEAAQQPHFETVVFVDIDQPGSAPYWHMTKITLEDGSSVVVTNPHMVPILTDKNNISELRAD